MTTTMTAITARMIPAINAPLVEEFEEVAVAEPTVLSLGVCVTVEPTTVGWTVVAAPVASTWNDVSSSRRMVVAPTYT